MIQKRELVHTRNSSSKNTTTTTMTFRVQSNIMQKLCNKSEQDGTSVNTLVNHILKGYLEWDRYFEDKAGMIPISKPVVRKLFQRLSREEVIDLAKGTATHAVYDIALFMKGGKLDVDSFISWYLLRMKNCSEISEDQEDDSSSCMYILKHDLGENWSLYHKTILDAICQDIFNRPIQTNITGSTLSFKFEQDKPYLYGRI